jgi:hypothetical protein
MVKVVKETLHDRLRAAEVEWWKDIDTNPKKQKQLVSFTIFYFNNVEKARSRGLPFTLYALEIIWNYLPLKMQQELINYHKYDPYQNS